MLSLSRNRLRHVGNVPRSINIQCSVFGIRYPIPWHSNLMTHGAKPKIYESTSTEYKASCVVVVLGRIKPRDTRPYFIFRPKSPRQ